MQSEQSARDSTGEAVDFALEDLSALTLRMQELTGSYVTLAGERDRAWVAHFSL